MQGGAGVLIDGGQLERPLIPADGGFRNALIQEALGQPGVGLHDVREGMTAIHRLAHLLQFADRFVQQAHFAEGHAEVVMGFRIFVRGGGVLPQARVSARRTYRRDPRPAPESNFGRRRGRCLRS